MINPELAIAVAVLGGVITDRVVTNISSLIHREEYEGERRLFNVIAEVTKDKPTLDRLRANMAETPDISERWAAAKLAHLKFFAAGLTSLAGLAAISLLHNLDIAQAALALSATYTIGGSADARRAGFKVIFNALNK